MTRRWRLPMPAAQRATTALRAPIRRRGSPEHDAQAAFFLRIHTLSLNDRRYAVPAERTHAIPNGGGRSKAEAGRLKSEGVKAGVSDVFVAYPVAHWHGLYIEMKRPDGGTLSEEQRRWLAESERLGYLAVCCRGADEAWTVWRAYVDGGLDAAIE